MTRCNIGLCTKEATIVLYYNIHVITNLCREHAIGVFYNLAERLIEDRPPNE